LYTFKIIFLICSLNTTKIVGVGYILQENTISAFFTCHWYLPFLCYCLWNLLAIY